MNQSDTRFFLFYSFFLFTCKTLAASSKVITLGSFSFNFFPLKLLPLPPFVALFILAKVVLFKGDNFEVEAKEVEEKDLVEFEVMVEHIGLIIDIV